MPEIVGAVAHEAKNPWSFSVVVVAEEEPVTRAVMLVAHAMGPHAAM